MGSILVKGTEDGQRVAVGVRAHHWPQSLGTADGQWCQTAAVTWGTYSLASPRLNAEALEGLFCWVTHMARPAWM